MSPSATEPKIAFILPTTSKGLDIKDILDTPLNKLLLKSLGDLSKKFTFFIGYDEGDKIYDDPLQQKKLSANYSIIWVKCKVQKGHLTAIWNGLARGAVKRGYEYLYICGDDLVFQGSNDWLPLFIKTLQEQNNLGWVAAFSGNKKIPTQFFVHKTHLDIFGFVYPSEITNIHHDSFMANIYPSHLRNWLTDIRHVNTGSKKRYDVKEYKNLQELIEQKRKTLDSFLLKKEDTPLNKKQKHFLSSEFLSSLDEKQTKTVLNIMKDVKGQLKQDLFALTQHGFKKNGYFVEFGATNGVSLSNTHLLEKHFSWQGIVAEPSTRWHDALNKNRQCHIELDCVWKTTGQKLIFNEVEAGELSTIDEYSTKDLHSKSRQNGKKYPVKTISLIDLLKKYNAPKEIDYLSIDTEGSELDILSAFNFEEYEFKVITCEHNFTPDREKIYALLTSKGYQRIFEKDSYQDDWYIKI